MQPVTIGRRDLLGAAAGAAAALLIAPAGAADERVIRKTARGLLGGRRSAGIDRFLGIPFAAPPVGNLRFLPPQPTQPWKGVREADRFGPAPMQAPGRPSANVPDPPPVSEDCLYLNVWAPSKQGPHPVFVWIHGGGNVAGSSSMPVFDGSRFADDGILCVSLTYRVGAFGFLELGELLGPSYKGSGNNGLRDLIAGLEWVRSEIENFGGDPGNVTVGGQSAGAKNVAALMAIPEARKLFQRAIIQSGGGHTAATLEAAQNLAVRLLGECGLSVSSATGLRSIPGPVLVSAQQRVSATYPRKYPFRSVIDGVLLRQSPGDSVASGAARSIPILIGTTRDESAFFGPSKNGDGKVNQQELANMSLGRFEAILARYPSVFPKMSAEAVRYHALTAEEYWIPTLRLADAHSAAGGKTYLYRFDLAPMAGASRDLSIHGSELPLVWDKLDDPLSAYLGPTGPVAVRVSRQMHAAWVAFIRSGNPSGGGLRWEAYDPTRRLGMRFDGEPRTISDIDRPGRLLWDDWVPAAYRPGD